MTEQIVPIFRVADALATAEWYARLGFTLEGVHQFEPDFPRYGFLKRGDVQIHLSEHTGDANPHGLAYLWVDDVDAIAAEFEVTPSNEPWGREIELTDPDGNRLRIATPN
ncbi:MAG: glyoxalase superfamily protein [Actinomycetota bacterium]